VRNDAYYDDASDYRAGKHGLGRDAGCRHVVVSWSNRMAKQYALTALEMQLAALSSD
jgi:hypothetical protein